MKAFWVDVRPTNRGMRYWFTADLNLAASGVVYMTEIIPRTLQDKYYKLCCGMFNRIYAPLSDKYQVKNSLRGWILL
jgi:hypothetical protein